jgi:hypothetical protein
MLTKLIYYSFEDPVGVESVLLGVADGLQVNSDQATRIDYSAQDEHAHGQRSIKSDSRK